MKNLSHSIIFETTSLEVPDVQDLIKILVGSTKNNPDYFEIKTNIDRQSITIEQTREMISWLQLKPYQSENKLALIQQAEKLTIEAQNSLLKTLEEPPLNSYIFLITKNHKRLLKTILSRSRLIRISQEGNNLSNNKGTPSVITEGTLDLAADKLIEKPIKSKIEWIEKIVKIKNPIERREMILSFLDSLHAYLLDQKDRTEQLSNFILLEETYTALRKHINTRLVLENLLFNLR